ncbi:FG-GAP-like repeat-containing protein [Streptomyces sp. NPDC021224]|uniref:FG-GAP-like repeat-containing protein n=1 Tax=unclassified Streptomyces TaxID=2593676 RepID=UPI00379D6246
MKRRRLRAIVVAAAAALGLSAGAMAPAHAAATGWNRCPKGSFCLFDGLNGTGSMIAYTSSHSSLGSWDNKADSVYNRTGMHAVSMYSLPGYRYDDPVHDVVVNWDDSGESQLNLDGFADANSHMLNNLSSFRLAHTAREAEGGPEYLQWQDPTWSSGGSGLAFSDLNNDGNSDMLLRTWSGKLWYLPGDGSGTLIGSGWNAMSALTRHGDFTGEGSEDLLARDTTGKLWLYPGNGRGAFTSRKLIGSGWNAMSALQAAGDLTGDGKDDLLARDTTGKLWLYPGNGRGAFTTRKLIGSGWNAMRAFAAPGDLNGDRRNDLVVSDSAGKLWLYPGNGKGAFTTRKALGASGWGRFDTLLGSHYSGGSRPDLLAIAPPEDGVVFLYESRSGGTLAAGQYIDYIETGDKLL